MAAPAQAYYITQAWNDLPKYVCPGCGYDTLRTVQIEAHQQHCAPFHTMLAAHVAPTEAEPPADTPEEEEPEGVPVPDEPEPTPAPPSEPEG
jgi:hypothetical protein